MLSYRRASTASQQLGDPAAYGEGRTLTRLGLQYFKHVLAPEFTEPSGIPSLFPYPSTVIRFNTTYVLPTTKTNGMIMFQPEFAFGSNAYILSSFVPTNAGDSNVVAGGENGIWTSPSLTANFSSGRVVAACIKVRYIGAPLTASGFFACAMIRSTEAPSAAGDASVTSLQAIIDCPTHVVTSWNDGVRCIWTPIDENDFDYYAINVNLTEQTGRIFIVYQGMPAAGQLLIEAYVTYELLPTVGAQNLFPGKCVAEDKGVMTALGQYVTAVQSGTKNLDSFREVFIDAYNNAVKLGASPTIDVIKNFVTQGGGN